MAILSINVMKLLAKLRNVDGYENMFRQQPQNTFATPFASELNLEAEPKSALEAKTKIRPLRKIKIYLKSRSKRKIKT